MKKILGIIAAVATTATYSSVQPSLHAASYEVRGSLDHFGFYGRESFTNSTPFTMVVSGEQWQINNNEGGISNSAAICDGTNIFYFDKSKVIVFRGQSPLPPDSYVVAVEAGPVPSGGLSGGGGVRVLWFAYESSVVVGTNSDDLPAPWLNARYIAKAHAYKSKVEVLGDSPYLPSSASFTLTESRVNNAAANPWLVHEGPAASHPDYQHWKLFEPYGFIGARYNVLATTNIHGLRLPVNFELVILRPSSETPTMEIYRGANIVIREIASRKIEPKALDKPIFVTDFRFQSRERHIDFIRYVAKQWITSAQSPDLETLFEQKLKDPGIGPRSLLSPGGEQSSKSSNWVRAAIFIVFISPLLLIAYRRLFKRAATSAP
ncbi:MAG: hypothetical protein ABSH15_08250 [Verrucomicrobiota bacterium]|jgi:hypothetical protein